MTTFPGSPKLLKGSIISIDPETNRIVGVIAFQYNPDSISRTLQVQMAGGEDAAREEAMRLEGAPVETIKLDIEFDATDGLEKAAVDAVALGVYPQLAALETLIYPASATVVKNMTLAKAGALEIIPMQALTTLLVWGKQRVLPIRIGDFSIEETAYDTRLNPIHAKVSLSLQVLNYSNLPWGERSAQLFLGHHQLKEILAKKASLSSLGSVARNIF